MAGVLCLKLTPPSFSHFYLLICVYWLGLFCPFTFPTHCHFSMHYAVYASLIMFHVLSHIHNLLISWYLLIDAVSMFQTPSNEDDLLRTYTKGTSVMFPGLTRICNEQDYFWCIPLKSFFMTLTYATTLLCNSVMLLMFRFCHLKSNFKSFFMRTANYSRYCLILHVWMLHKEFSEWYSN